MWRQEIAFDQAKAGKVPTECLKNNRLGYGISYKYPTATAAWEHTEQHKDRNIPTGVSVPLYYYWFGKVDGVAKNWGHINEMLPDGRVWNDGRIYASLDDFLAKAPIVPKPKYLGWGESINSVRIIENKEDDMSKWNDGRTYNLLFHACNKAIADRAAADNYKNYFGHLSGKDAGEASDEILRSAQFGLLRQEAAKADKDAAVPPNATILAPGVYKVN